MQLRAQPQAGFMLAEVMVAMVVAALALLTLTGLHAKALQASRMVQHRVVATQLVADLAERLRANPAGVRPTDGRASAYQLTATWAAQQGEAGPAGSAACDSPALRCSPTAFAQADLAQWQALVRRSLPSGAAWVQIDAAAGLADIGVAWADALPAAADESPAESGQCPAAWTGVAGVHLRCVQARMAW